MSKEKFIQFRKFVLEHQFDHALGILRNVKHAETTTAFCIAYYAQESCLVRYDFPASGVVLKEQTSLLGFIIFHAQRKLLQALFEMGISLVPKNCSLTSPLIMLLHAMGTARIDQSREFLLEGILYQATKERRLPELLALKDSYGRTLNELLDNEAFVSGALKAAQLKKYSIVQRRIGRATQFENFNYASKFYTAIFDNANFLDITLPERQKGPNCGYYAIAFVMQYWQIYCKFKFNYFARSRDSLFNKSSSQDIALKKLAKKVGISGIGGLFDINYFSKIVADTEFHSQVVTFSTKQELKNIVLTALQNKLPVILPVDWVDTKNGLAIGMENGERSHYVTLIGYVDHGDEQAIYFVSSAYFYQVSLNDLFLSNDNLQITSTRYYSKVQQPDSEWEDKGLKKPAHWHKLFVMETHFLHNLRNHAALVYPKALRAEYEKLFVPSLLVNSVI